MIEETEVHINTEKGTCDCCMDDNVEILTFDGFLLIEADPKKLH